MITWAAAWYSVKTNIVGDHTAGFLVFFASICDAFWLNVFAFCAFN